MASHIRICRSIGSYADKCGDQPDDTRYLRQVVPWAIATAFMLFFAMLNSLQSLRADSFVKYWQASMYSYMLLAFGNAMIAWGFSGTSISDAESYKWIFLVVSIGFIVFLSMVNFMKVIVKFAEKEEWTEPRKRK